MQNLQLSPNIHESLIQQINIMGCMVEYTGRLNGFSNVPPSLQRVVLRHGVGRFCTANRWPGIRRGERKACYQNAGLMATNDPARFIYMEGYGIRPELGTVVGEHAWVLDKQRDYEVVDPTWRNTKGAAYLGIPFSHEYIVGEYLKYRLFGLLDTYWSQWPIRRLSPEQYLHPEADQIPRDFTVTEDLPDPTVELERLEKMRQAQ